MLNHKLGDPLTSDKLHEFIPDAMRISQKILSGLTEDTKNDMKSNRPTLQEWALYLLKSRIPSTFMNKTMEQVDEETSMKVQNTIRSLVLFKIKDQVNMLVKQSLIDTLCNLR